MFLKLSTAFNSEIAVNLQKGAYTIVAVSDSVSTVV